MNTIPPTQYRAMQEDLIRYKCVEGKAYVALDCQKEPIYLSRMEELFGVTVEIVRTIKSYEPSCTMSTTANNNSYITVRTDVKHAVVVVFNSEKPVFATCPDCGTRFNTMRVGK